MILPKSCTISSNLLEIHPNPFAAGGFGDAFHGAMGSSKVCIKRTQIFNPDELRKVTGVRLLMLSLSLFTIYDETTDLLQGGGNLGKPDTREYCTPPRCHYQSPTAHFELDGWRTAAGVHQKTSQCRHT